MGNYLCSADLNVNIFEQTLQIAIKDSFQCQQRHIILEKNKQTLKMLMKNSRNTKIILENTHIQVIIRSQQECQIQRQKLKILLTQQVEQFENNSLSQSATTHFSKRKGYIFYRDAYYFGEILKDNMNGEGTIYITNTPYLIEGLWQKNSFKKGNIKQKIFSKPNQYIITQTCSIQLIDSFRDAKISNDDFQYRGSIKLESSTKLSQILTGQGHLFFKKSGDQYFGQLVNGLFETSSQKPAKIVYGEGIIKSFQGYFKKGQKNNRGVLIFGNDGQYRLNLNFIKGKPVDNGFLSAGFQQYGVQVNNQQLKLISFEQ